MLAVNKAGNGSGSVTGNPAGIDYRTSLLSNTPVITTENAGVSKITDPLKG